MGISFIACVHQAPATRQSTSRRQSLRIVHQAPGQWVPSDTWHRASVTRWLSLVTSQRAPVTGHQTLITSHQALGTRHQSLGTGYHIASYRHSLNLEQSVTNEPPSSMNNQRLILPLEPDFNTISDSSIVIEPSINTWKSNRSTSQKI